MSLILALVVIFLIWFVLFRKPRSVEALTSACTYQDFLNWDNDPTDAPSPCILNYLNQTIDEDEHPDPPPADSSIGSVIGAALAGFKSSQ